MEKRCYILVVLFAISLSGCGDRNEKNDEVPYFGNVLALVQKYNESEGNIDSRIKYSRMIIEERERIIGTELPCEIAEGAPLKVIEPMRILDFNEKNFTYSGKMVVTKDIPWDSSISYRKITDWTVIPEYETKRYIYGNFVGADDAILPEMQDNNYYCPEPVRRANDYVLSYIHIRFERSISHITDKGTDKCYSVTVCRLKNAYDIEGYTTNEKHPLRKGGQSSCNTFKGNPDPPFEGQMFWEEGDTVIVGATVGWNPSLRDFKCIRYDLSK